MKLVGAPARGDIDDRSGISSILCAEGGVIHSKFINSIDCGLERDLVLCNTANLKIDLVLPRSGRIEGKRALAAQRRGQKAILRRRYRARNQQGKIDKMPPV